MRRPIGTHTGEPTSLERAAILVDVLRPRAGRTHAEVVVGILRTVAGEAIADLEVRGGRGRPVHELVAVRDAAREARARAGSEHLLTGVGDERQLALEHEDELVL